MKVKFSKSQWEKMGKEAGWLDESIGDLTTSLKPPQPTFAMWMMHMLGQAIEGKTVEGHGPFRSLEFNSTINGVRRIFRDVSNGQDYEVTIQVMRNPKAMD